MVPYESRGLAGESGPRATRMNVAAAWVMVLAVSACTVSPQPTTPPPDATPGWSTPTSPEVRRRLADVELRTLTVEEAFSSTTVRQWVKQSDFVAVVRIESEDEIPPEKVDIRRG